MVEEDKELYHANLPDIPPEVAIALSVVPYPRDDNRARYLGYMSCGFAVREALKMVGLSKSWLSWCRTDTKFAELENRIPEFRKTLAHEYAELEFFRNFRLALEKDYRVLWKSVHPSKVEALSITGDKIIVDEPLNKQEHEYLLKIRSQYSMEQLHILESIVSGSGGDGFNFAKWVAENADVVKMSRTDTVTVLKHSTDILQRSPVDATETEDS